MLSALLELVLAFIAEVLFAIFGLVPAATVLIAIGGATAGYAAFGKPGLLVALPAGWLGWQLDGWFDRRQRAKGGEHAVGSSLTVIVFTLAILAAMLALALAMRSSP